MSAVMTDYDLATCWRCGGPCLTYKGSVHGWTCNSCIAAYLAQGAAKADARDRRDRVRLLAKRTTPTTSVTAVQRQEGGARVMYRTPSGAD